MIDLSKLQESELIQFAEALGQWPLKCKKKNKNVTKLMIRNRLLQIVDLKQTQKMRKQAKKIEKNGGCNVKLNEMSELWKKEQQKCMNMFLRA